jgi:hypothetical protein
MKARLGVSDVVSPIRDCSLAKVRDEVDPAFDNARVGERRVLRPYPSMLRDAQ